MKNRQNPLSAFRKFGVNSNYCINQLLQICINNQTLFSVLIKGDKQQLYNIFASHPNGRLLQYTKPLRQSPNRHAPENCGSGPSSAGCQKDRLVSTPPHTQAGSNPRSCPVFFFVSKRCDSKIIESSFNGDKQPIRSDIFCILIL